MDQWEQALKRAEEALKQIARRERSSVETVRKHIQLAIISGMTNPNPAVQAQWAKIPCRGVYPTPEEVIAYEALRVEQEDTLL